jgi:tetratricopeptide (TPR) repeat protein
MSRGGMFSLIAALLFMAGLTLTRRSIKKKGWVLSAVVIFIVLTIAWLGATPVVERILSIKAEIASRYFGGRLPIWQGTLEIIKDYPIFGTGLGTFNYIFPKYQPAQIITRHYTYAHSDFLELLSETGIVGLLLSSFFFLLSLVYLFKRFNVRHDPWAVGISIGLFGSLVSIFIHSSTDFNLHIPANAILLTLILAIILIVLNLKKDKFGERVVFRKKYFRFSRISTITKDNPKKIQWELFRVSLYPVVLAVFGLYIFIALRPALADYYFQAAKGLSPLFRSGQAPKRTVSKSNIPEGVVTVSEGVNQEILSAIRYTLNAIRLDPSNAIYHYYLGKLYSEQAKNDEYRVASIEHLESSIEHLESSIELNPTNSRYHQSLAWSYGQLADLHSRASSIEHRVSSYRRKAIDEFKLAVSLEPNNPYRHRAYAIYCLNQAKSINEPSRSLLISPRVHPEARRAEGSHINPKASFLNTAIFEYRQAVNINPSLAREAIERLFPFTKDYNKLKEILPNLPEFHYILANFLQEKNVWLENEIKFKDEMSNAMDKSLYYIALAQWSYKRKDFDKAFSILYECLTLYPNNAKVHFTIAEYAIYGVGDWKEAFKEFEKALELQPGNTWYRYWYAVHLFRNKKYQKAEKQFKKVIELDPTYSNRIEIFKRSNGRKAE